MTLLLIAEWTKTVSIKFKFIISNSLDLDSARNSLNSQSSLRQIKTRKNLRSNSILNKNNTQSDLHSNSNSKATNQKDYFYPSQIYGQEDVNYTDFNNQTEANDDLELHDPDAISIFKFYNILLSNIDSKKIPSNISSKMISRRHNKSKKVIDLSKEGKHNMKFKKLKFMILSYIVKDIYSNIEFDADRTKQK